MLQLLLLSFLLFIFIKGNQFFQLPKWDVTILRLRRRFIWRDGRKWEIWPSTVPLVEMRKLRVVWSCVWRCSESNGSKWKLFFAFAPSISCSRSDPPTDVERGAAFFSSCTALPTPCGNWENFNSKWTHFFLSYLRASFVQWVCTDSSSFCEDPILWGSMYQWTSFCQPR